MRKKKAAFVCLFATFSLWSTQNQVFAWGNTWMGLLLGEAVNRAGGRVGAFRYNTTLHVFNAGYDSDIYFGMLDNPVPDYTLTLGVSVQVFLPLKQKAVFDISDSPQYVYYLRTDQERALNNTFVGNVHFVFDRVYAQAGSKLSNVKQLLSSELNMYVRLKEDDVSGLIFWQASGRTSFALQYQRSKYNYENLTTGFPNISESLNRTESVCDIIAYLQQQSRVRFNLQGQYGSYIFEREVSRFRDCRSYGVYAGVGFLPPAGGLEGQASGTRGSARLGYMRLNILDPLRKDYSGLAGDIGVSLRIIKLTALRLFFSRGPRFSVYSDQAYYVQTAYGAGLGRSLSKRVLFTYDLAYGRNDYPSGEVNDGDEGLRSVDRYLTHAFRLNFLMRRNLELSLLANLGRRNSQLAPRPVSDHTFIGLSLTYGYAAGRIYLPTGPLY
jgi:hypothetical protein